MDSCRARTTRRALSGVSLVAAIVAMGALACAGVLLSSPAVADESPAAAAGETPVPADAAAGQSPAAGTAEKTTLQVGWTQNLDSLNPFVGYQNVSYTVYYLNYDTLVRYDPRTLAPVAGLADEWEFSEDGRTWTFHIRDGVKWQDGEPLTARDVAFTYNYIIENELSAFTMYTTHIEKAVAVDDSTVRFECSKPRGTLLQMWAPILPEHIWGKIDPEKAQTTYANDPPVVGSGPFQVVEWKRNQYVRLAANQDYWGGAPKVDEIIFRSYTNPETLAADLRTGALDMSNYIDPAQFKQFEDKPGWVAHQAVGDYFDELGFNCYDGPSKGHPILRDPAFRQAVGWAIDREEIARIAFHGRATAADSFLPSDYWSEPMNYHWEPPDDQKQVYDPEKAAQMLDDAGYRDTDGDGVREYKGEPIKLRLWATQDKAAYAPAGKLITGWLEEVGLDIEFQSMDDGTVSDHMYAYEGDVFTPDFDLFIWGWGGDYDPGFLCSIFLTDQIENWSDSNWSNEEYDRLFAEQEACLDPDQRLQLVHRMQQLVYEENPYIILVYPQTLEVYNTADWEGWVNMPAGTGTISNNYTYTQVRPKAAVVESGSNTGLIVGIAVAAVVVVGAIVAFVVLRRRRPRAEQL